MAVVKLNPCYDSINGRIDSLVFYSYYNKTFCRKHVIPYNPRTENQQKNRTIFKDAVKSWQKLSKFEKNLWNVRSQGASGYNYYISRFIKYKSKYAASPSHKKTNAIDLNPCCSSAHSSLPNRSLANESISLNYKNTEVLRN